MRHLNGFFAFDDEKRRGDCGQESYLDRLDRGKVSFGAALEQLWMS
jgi:hypothetical protein